MSEIVAVSYDLHLHSCLSPCGDNEMTPANIAGMAAVKELDVIALTDHNTCRNCEAAIKAGENYGVLVIPGMELTTIEEVHVICLFETLDKALVFDSYVYQHLQAIPNQEDIFGKQIIMNEEDQIIGYEPNLLINATDISFDTVYDLVSSYNGIMIPAHIDKSANSLLANLGFVPPDSKFKCAELKDIKKLHSIQAANPYIKDCMVITNSDAHYLEHINEPVNHLYVKEKSRRAVLSVLERVR